MRRWTFFGGVGRLTWREWLVCLAWGFLGLATFNLMIAGLFAHQFPSQEALVLFDKHLLRIQLAGFPFALVCMNSALWQSLRKKGKGNARTHHS